MTQTSRHPDPVARTVGRLAQAIITALILVLVVWGIVSLVPGLQPDLSKGRMSAYLFTVGLWFTLGYMHGSRDRV